MVMRCIIYIMPEATLNSSLEVRVEPLFIERSSRIKIVKVLGKIRIEWRDPPGNTYETDPRGFACLNAAIQDAARKIRKSETLNFDKLAADPDTRGRVIHLLKGKNVGVFWDSLSRKTDITEFLAFARAMQSAADAAKIYPEMFESQQGFSVSKAFMEFFRRRDTALTPPKEVKTAFDRAFPLSIMAIFGMLFSAILFVITLLFLYEFVQIGVAVLIASTLVFVLLVFKTGLSWRQYGQHLDDFVMHDFLPTFSLAMETGGKSLEILTVFMMVALFMAVYFSKAIPWILHEGRKLSGF